MLQNIWNSIKTICNRINTWLGSLFENQELQLHVLNQRYAHLYQAYLELDKRTTAARQLREEMDAVKLEIDELEERIYG